LLNHCTAIKTRLSTKMAPRLWSSSTVSCMNGMFHRTWGGLDEFVVLVRGATDTYLPNQDAAQLTIQYSTRARLIH
jgi:hypothetical protein